MSRTKEWIGDIPSHNPFWDTIFQKKILYLKSGYNLAMQASKRVTIFPVLKKSFCTIMSFNGISASSWVFFHIYIHIFHYKCQFMALAISNKIPPPKKKHAHTYTCIPQSSAPIHTQHSIAVSMEQMIEGITHEYMSIPVWGAWVPC